jgi:anti-sigma B factor antagonist
VDSGVGEVDSRPNGEDAIAVDFRVSSEWYSARFAVVRPHGELDLLSASDLRQELFGLIEDGATTILVDLEDTTFIDSMTISVLLGAVRRLQQRGGELRIACADPNIKRIFEMTLLDRVFAMYPSRESALGHSAVGR